ncbi:MAG: DHA2 family efflux MFS transporter permease subunit [Sinobacteraceae bacterium]|nr:DHA2 family efflux MFS transporter permease subunit [Nevskiaceae bacterium]
MMASAMQALDNTIANVALPRIQGSLSTTQDQMTWVLTSYIIAAAIMTPLSGWLAGQIGRRRVFLFSLVGFTLSSALCGLAQSLPEIVMARLLQGLSGAALVPMSQAILLDINPPHRHARAMAMWAMAITIGPILGPALGAWLTETYSWRWVFYINVPLGILSFVGTLAFVWETPLHKSRFDFFGFATLSLAVGALQLMLDRGQIEDWFGSPQIWAFACVSAVAFYLFIVHALTTTEAPFVNLAVFKDRNFATGSLFIFIIGALMFATLALLPPLLQDLMNYPVTLTGWITAPRGLGSLVAMFIVGRIVGRVDTRIILATGFGLAAISSWQMTNFYLQMDVATVLWSGVLQGLGTGLVYVPLASAAFGTLPPARRNEGTALFSLIRNIGSSIGISAVTTLLTRNTQMMHARLGENITAYLNPWHPGIAASTQSMAMLNQTVTSQAAMIAYNNNFKLMTILTLCTIPLVLLLRKPSAQAHAEPVVVE